MRIIIAASLLFLSACTPLSQQIKPDYMEAYRAYAPCADTLPWKQSEQCQRLKVRMQAFHLVHEYYERKEWKPSYSVEGHPAPCNPFGPCFF